MSDRIEDAVARLRDIVSCQCSEEYTSRGRHDPKCNCDYREDVEAVIEVLRRHRDVEYDPMDIRTWPYYPVVMPLKEGKGPVSEAECDQITFEVWDLLYNSHGSFGYLPDAINEAMRLTREQEGQR